MTYCPECHSYEVEEDVYSPDTITDGQGYEWRVIHSYTCEKCGCEFTETFHTTREIEIDKHGKKEWYSDMERQEQRIAKDWNNERKQRRFEATGR